MANMKDVKTNNVMTKAVLMAAERMEKLKERSDLGSDPFMGYRRSPEEQRQIFQSLGPDEIRDMASRDREGTLKLIKKFGNRQEGR